tara:strand:- start:330 stop:488 length:159 start_codon:yes stop_codon:yes gene_type:complete
MKEKRLTFKYLNETDEYLLLKVQNVKGMKPKQKIASSELDKLHSSDIEVIIK